MSLDRNLIFDALFQLAKTAVIVPNGQKAFVTTKQRLEHWTSVPAQPALFVIDGDEMFMPRGEQIDRAKVILDAELWIYCKASSDEQAPTKVLNPLLQALEQVLQPANPVVGVQNLGLPGVVQRCWIEGALRKSYDVNTGQLLALVPVKILVIS